MNWNKFKSIVDILTDGEGKYGLTVGNVLDILKYLISDKIKEKEFKIDGIFSEDASFINEEDVVRLFDVKIKDFKYYIKLSFGHWTCGIYDSYHFDPLGEGEIDGFNFQSYKNGNLDKLCGYYCLYFLFCFKLKHMKKTDEI